MEKERSSENDSVSSNLHQQRQPENGADNMEKLHLVAPVSNSFSSISTVGRNLCLRRKVFFKRSSGPLSENTLKGIADYILAGKCKNAVLLTGAGISTSSGIPDFRSLNNGIYSTVEKLNLPCPEAIFDINYFKMNPKPLYSVFRSFVDTLMKARPTLTHYFIKLMASKGILLRNYSQNVDGMEYAVGLDPEYLVEAHGSLCGASCVNCRFKVDIRLLYREILADRVCLCPTCGSLVKPDIVFFGERLPDHFYESVENDCKQCDLMIIAGTSLCVYPISLITQLVSPDTPRVLINREKVGTFRLDDETSSQAFSEVSSISELKRENDTVVPDDQMTLNERSLDEGPSDDNPNENMELMLYDRDVVWLGNTDEGFRELAGYLGWSKELEDLMRLPINSPFSDLFSDT